MEIAIIVVTCLLVAIYCLNKACGWYLGRRGGYKPLDHEVIKDAEYRIRD